ncbi:hypothetical protein E4U13_005868 [Claviceps humidiphila]|uniref:Uncharacterized protein n=1 Tax=Claviceps humidiphila TaxID=1294629 RepID=A0A9P7TSK1_9HYPO|nr:hypothetical protein E4U13_005868 [Claviceps humidiphila]
MECITTTFSNIIWARLMSGWPALSIAPVTRNSDHIQDRRRRRQEHLDLFEEESAELVTSATSFEPNAMENFPVRIVLVGLQSPQIP